MSDPLETGYRQKRSRAGQQISPDRLHPLRTTFIAFETTSLTYSAGSGKIRATGVYEVWPHEMAWQREFPAA